MELFLSRRKCAGRVKRSGTAGSHMNPNSTCRALGATPSYD